MPSQHGATNWVQKETRRLVHRSVELVKSAMPSKVEATGAPALADNSPIVNERMIPEILEKGIMMTKISDDKQKKVFFQIDPDEGAIKYKSSSGGMRTSALFAQYMSNPPKLISAKYPLNRSRKSAPTATLNTIASSSNNPTIWKRGG